MKKSVILCLTFLYLLPAVGFSIGMHVCGNKVTSVTIENFGAPECSCGSGMKAGCCKNIHAYFNITEVQKTSAELTISKFDTANKLFCSTAPIQINNGFPPSDPWFSGYHSPPPDGRPAVYLVIRVFRI